MESGQGADSKNGSKTALRRPRIKARSKPEIPDEARSRPATSDLNDSLNRTSLSLLSNADTLIAKGGTIGISSFDTTGVSRESIVSPQDSLNLDRHCMHTSDDLGKRAAFYSSFERSITTSERRYRAAFQSKAPKHALLPATASGFLEYQNTPRSPPCIRNCITRPATSNLGAENEITYHSTFKSKSQFPRPIESKIHGGSILSTFDSRVETDSHGKYLVTAKSMAQDALGTLRTYASSFGSKKPPNNAVKEMRLDYRHQDGGVTNFPTNLQQVVEASELRYSGMTTRSSGGDRFPLGRSETRDVKDFYDIGNCTPCPDLSVKVERSPILYSVFNSVSHSGEWDNRRLRDVNDIQMLGQDAFASTPRGLRWQHGERFAPPGHPDNMFPVPTCRNEQFETVRHTIAERIGTSPIKYFTMHSLTTRTTPIDLSRGQPGRRTAPPAAINESHDHDMVTRGLPLSQMPLAGLVDQSARNYQSAFSSSVDRFRTDYSLNPSETLEHHKRRQHLLESRILSIRDEMHKKSPKISHKLKKILNL